MSCGTGMSERFANPFPVPLSVFDISDVPRSELYAKVMSKRQNPIIKPIMIPQKITEKKFPTHKNKSTRLIFPIFSKFLHLFSLADQSETGKIKTKLVCFGYLAE